MLPAAAIRSFSSTNPKTATGLVPCGGLQILPMRAVPIALGLIPQVTPGETFSSRELLRRILLILRTGALSSLTELPGVHRASAHSVWRFSRPAQMAGL